MKQVIIILGSPNSVSGRLGKIAIERAEKCLVIFNPETDSILCTGGFGEHFNISKKPHYTYLKQFLIKNGIDDNWFLPSADSQNTVEDAVKSKEILSKISVQKITIITTQYHLERVKLIFDEILSDIEKNYIGVVTNLSDRKLKKLEEHEKQAIEGILKNGLYY